jgi:glutathione synthase
LKKILFIIDSLEKLNWKRDTSLLLAYNASLANNIIYFCYNNEIFYSKGEIFCNCQEIAISNISLKKYTEGNKQQIQLNNFQIIFIRKNPPFDLTYLTITHLLSSIDQNKTLIINNPSIFQTSSEKILTLNFKEFIPETLITNDFNEAEKFLHQNKTIILKPIYNYSSNDIFLININDMNFKQIFDNLLQKYYNCHMFVQKFIKNVTKGDKRILILDEKILGSFLRIPKKNSILSGTVHGSEIQLSSISDQEHKICKKIIEFLKKNDIYFAGIDVIDEHLTEINFTSPTGLPILNELTNIDHGQIAWDVIEQIYIKKIKNNYLEV